jgi:MoxR-like ATPase
MRQDVQSVQEWVQRESAVVDSLLGEVRKVIVGQRYLLERMMIGLLADGHLLLEGVPGLAKTQSVSTQAQAVSGSFQRIQFTPDLLPADLTGTLIYNQKEGNFVPRKGPLFANFVLADEINRAPAKVQSALLESMQERQVTIGDTTYPLPRPFHVLATQNPIEQEGTYPLPEAQLDRFLFNIMVKYPSHAEELDIMRQVTSDEEAELNEVVDGKSILEFQHIVRRIPISDHVHKYAVTLVRATRPDEPGAPEFVKKLMAWGAGPRASLNLVLAGKARAALRGRCHVSIDDIRALCPPVLRHRIIPNFAARSEGMTPDALIAKLVEEIPSDEKLLEQRIC